MAEGEEQPVVTTESSKAVLKTVAGRLSSIEAGELPVIERVNADGTTGYAVDHTGEMVRPSADDVDAAREAAERFSAEHRDAPPPGPRPPAGGPVAPQPTEQPTGKGLWARIKAWFSPS